MGRDRCAWASRQYDGAPRPEVADSAALPQEPYLKCSLELLTRVELVEAPSFLTVKQDSPAKLRATDGGHGARLISALLELYISSHHLLRGDRPARPRAHFAGLTASASAVSRWAMAVGAVVVA